MRKAGSIKQCVLLIDLEGHRISVRAGRVLSDIMF